jgi:phage tail sheath protein FI
MFAFLTAEQKTGYRPRILGIPEYDTAEVTAQLRVIAKQLRAFSYSYCDGCDTIAEAKTYRETFAEREGMLIWPNFIAYNPLTGVNEEFPPWLMRWVCGR